MINLGSLRGCHRLHEFVRTQGYTIIVSDGVMSSENDIAVQSIIDAYDPLPEAKADAIKRITLEASKRVAAIYPFINAEKEEALGLYNFTTDIYLAIKPQAREALSGRLLDFKNIYDAAVAQINIVNAMTDWQAVDSYDSIGW